MLLRQQGQAGILPVIQEGNHQNIGIEVVPLVEGRLVNLVQVGQVADLGVEGLVVLLAVGHHPDHVPVLGELLGDRHRDRVRAQDDDPLLNQVRLLQLVNRVEDNRADDADNHRRQDESVRLGAGDGVEVAGHLQGRQDQGDRRHGQEAAGKRVALRKAPAEDQHRRQLGQDEAGHQDRDQGQGPRVGKELADVEPDPGHDEEERDQEAVTDRGQLLLGGLAGLEELHNHPRQKGPEDVLGPDLLGDGHQDEDQEEGQADVQLGRRLGDLVKPEEGLLEPAQENDRRQKEEDDQPELAGVAPVDRGVDGQGQHRDDLPEDRRQQDRLPRRPAEDLLLLEGRDHHAQGDGRKEDRRQEDVVEEADLVEDDPQDGRTDDDQAERLPRQVDRRLWIRGRPRLLLEEVKVDFHPRQKHQHHDPHCRHHAQRFGGRHDAEEALAEDDPGHDLGHGRRDAGDVKPGHR